MSLHANRQSNKRGQIATSCHDIRGSLLFPTLGSQVWNFIAIDPRREKSPELIHGFRLTNVTKKQLYT